MSRLATTNTHSNVPGELPKPGGIPEGTDQEAVAKAAIEGINNLSPEHLANHVIWRDLLSLTDTIRTIHSSDKVYNVFTKLLKAKSASHFIRSEEPPRLEQVGPLSWLDIDVTFTTKDGSLIGNNAATISVIQDHSGSFKIWMLRTWLENYEGHGHPDKPKTASTHGLANETSNQAEHVYDVIIAGGGQSGLGAAGRLGALGLDYILFNDRPSIGDNWGHRYDSLKWHTIKDYSSLPFGRTFEADDPYFVPVKKISQGYKQWAIKHGIKEQSSTTVDAAQWEETSQTWTVWTSGASGDQQWKCRDLVLSIGAGQKTPIAPTWASLEKQNASGFQGTVVHSAQYHNSKEFAGKRGIVIGAGSSGHDVALDMFENGLETTMVQRGTTFVFPKEWLLMAQGKDYNPGKSVEAADRHTVTIPNKISSEIINSMMWAGIQAQPELWDGLQKAGFNANRQGSLYDCIFCRLGGHYVDMGTSQKIVDGKIKVKNQGIKGFSKDGLLFEDGTEVKADLIVTATGYEHDYRKDVIGIVGKEIADKMDDSWGLDEEGELNAFAKPSGHPHLWPFSRGEVRYVRFFSRFLALQLQKQKLGEPYQPFLGNA